MDAFKIYATGTSAYLTLQSLPLLLTPSLIVTLAAAEPRKITDLETYLCRSFGLTLLALAILVALLTGALPLQTTTEQVDSEGNAKENPYAYPTLITTTTYHALSAFYLYAQIARGWRFGFVCGIVASSGLFCLGLWVALFGGDKGHRSKRTGADKRTSNFPFENKESARSVKKEDKKEKEKRRSVARTKSRGE